MGSAFAAPVKPSLTDEFMLTALAMNGPPEKLRQALRDYPEYQDDIGGNTLMHTAAQYGNLASINVLLEQGSKALTITNTFGQTPLVTAAIAHDPTEIHAQIVERLMAEARAKGICIASLLSMTYTIGAWMGFTENIFHKLNTNADISMLNYFLRIPEARSLIHQKDGHGSTPLLQTVIYNIPNTELIERYLEHSLDSLDTPSDYGWTPITCAARHGKSEVVILLRALGAIPSMNVPLDADAIALITAPIPDETVLAIRYRYHFRASLVSRLLRELETKN